MNSHFQVIPVPENGDHTWYRSRKSSCSTMARIWLALLIEAKKTLVIDGIHCSKQQATNSRWRKDRPLAQAWLSELIQEDAFGRASKNRIENRNARHYWFQSIAYTRHGRSDSGFDMDEILMLMLMVRWVKVKIKLKMWRESLRSQHRIGYTHNSWLG